MAKENRKSALVIISIITIFLILYFGIPYLIRYIEWKNAVIKNTSEAYLIFNEKHINSKYKIIADSLYEVRLWTEANTSNNIKKLQDYLNKFPMGKYENNANSKIENLFWKDIQSEKSIIIMENYLSIYPNGKFNNKVRRLLEEFKWDKVKNCNNKKMLFTFIGEFPKGVNRNEAIQIIRRIDYFEKQKYVWLIGRWKSTNDLEIKVDDSINCNYGTLASMYYGTYTLKGNILHFKAKRFLKNEVIHNPYTTYQYNQPARSNINTTVTDCDYYTDFILDFENNIIKYENYIFTKE